MDKDKMGFVAGLKDGMKVGLPAWADWTIKIVFLCVLAYILISK